MPSMHATSICCRCSMRCRRCIPFDASRAIRRCWRASDFPNGCGTESLRHRGASDSAAVLPTRSAMLSVALVLALLQASAVGPTDADTRAWWQRTSVLSADSMEGRDAGSRGYERAARHVARWLAAAGVKPLGDSGSWFQQVPMEEVAVTSAHLDVGGRALRFLYDVTIPAQSAPPALEGALVYRGY